MASNDIGDWYRGIPQLTRYWFTGSVVVPLVARLGFIHWSYFILDFNSMVYTFQFWRPLTAVLYYKHSIHYLINLYLLYIYSKELETGTFDGRPADYMFMLFFNWICLVLIGFIAEFMLLMDPMILSVVYVWCQLNKDTIVRFWFVLQFKAMYLPWVLLVFHWITQDDWFLYLMGIIVGHLYFFLMFKYPQDFGGAQLLHTPQFLYSYLPNRRGGVSGFGQEPVGRRRQDDDGAGGGRHNWGQGHNLGD